MTKLACNHCIEIEQLINEKKIDVDYFKFPSVDMSLLLSLDLSAFKQFADRVNKIKPILLHGLNPSPHNIGSSKFIDDLNIDIVKKLFEYSSTPGISLHLAGIDLTLPKNQNKSIIIKNILYFKEQFPNLKFVSFENVDGNPFMPDNKFGDCIEPNFISEIIHETDSDFLLDISHVYCSAKALNMDFYEYLHRLPLDKVYEIHINGWIETENDIMAHTKINELGYQTLQNILAEYTPKIITLEYGRRKDRIGCGIPLLSPNTINPKAKDEIEEQIIRINEIIRA